MFGILEPEWRKLGYSSKKEYEDAMVSAIEDRSKQDVERIRAQGKRELEAIEKEGEERLNHQRDHYKKKIAKFEVVGEKIIAAHNSYVDKKSAELKAQSKQRERQEKLERKQLKLQMKLDDMSRNIQIHQKMIELLLPYSSITERRQASIKEKQNKLAKMIQERDLFIRENNL